MIVSVYNKKNEIAGEIDLPDKIFAARWNPDLVHQVITAQRANRRRPWAHTKTRGEVSGGGRKPWRQKGTGRARHGSIRSPIWRGGGITFGPRSERNYSQKINKKMLRFALHSVLSKKLEEGQVKIVEQLVLEHPKTKLMAQLLKQLAAPNALVIPASDNRLIRRAAANLPKVKSAAPEALNVYDVLRYQQVLIDREAVGRIR